MPKVKRTALALVLATLSGGEVDGVGTLRADRRVGTAMGVVVGTLRSGAVVGAMVGVASGTGENLGDLRSGTAVGALVGT